MQKLMTKIKDNKTLFLMIVLCLAMSSMCFASETSVEAPDFTPIITALNGVITPTILITIIAATIAVGAGFVLMWFGFRKLKSAFVRGFSKGKL